jgi:DNA-directed RNA polymerase subunit RPC12/RpoP
LQGAHVAATGAPGTAAAVITVVCSGCGTTFQARDEHAGKRGKCPRCGVAVLVPEASDATEVPAPAAPPAAVAETPSAYRGPGRSHAQGPRLSRGAREAAASRGPLSRRERGHQSPARDTGPPKWLLPSIAGVILLGVVAWFALGPGGPDPVKLIQDGSDLAKNGKYAEAIAKFEQVPRSSGLYGQAQERLKEARGQQGAIESTNALHDADELAQKIETVRKDWVEKPGTAAPRYAAHTRYMLKLAREFTERFPNDPRVADMRALAVYYRNVASLERPPGDLDVRVEIEWRAESRQYMVAAAVIDEYAASPDADSVQVIKLRDYLREMAEKDWKNIKALLERTLAFEPGNENWKQIRSRTASYLAAIGTLEDVGDEARELNAKANAALGVPGG